MSRFKEVEERRECTAPFLFFFNILIVEMSMSVDDGDGAAAERLVITGFVMTTTIKIPRGLVSSWSRQLCGRLSKKPMT